MSNLLIFLLILNSIKLVSVQICDFINVLVSRHHSTECEWVLIEKNLKVTVHLMVGIQTETKIHLNPTSLWTVVLNLGCRFVSPAHYTSSIQLHHLSFKKYTQTQHDDHIHYKKWKCCSSVAQEHNFQETGLEHRK